MSMNLPSIGSAQTPYGLASIHVGRYPVGGALFVELYTADDEMPEPLAMLSCNLAPSGVTLADDEFCVKSWSENEPLIEPLLATGLWAVLSAASRNRSAVCDLRRLASVGKHGSDHTGIELIQ